MRMVLLVGAVAVACVGCGSNSTAESPAGECLARHDYVLIGGGATSTWKGPEGQYVNLTSFDGVVQPVGQEDLDNFRAAGCL